MIYKLLGRMLKTDPYDGRYTPKPGHLVYAVFLLLTGSIAIGFEYWAGGLTLFMFGFLLGLTVILGMNWDKAIEYWDTIDRVAKTMLSIKDPAVRNEVWKSMGYNHVPTTAQIEVIETRRNNEGVFEGRSIKRIPVNVAVMQRIADKVLTSGKVEFQEEVYASIVPNFRKVQRQLKASSYLVPKNKNNVRGGYKFNHQGIDMLYEYASEGVKLEMKRKREDNNGKENG